MVGFGALAAVAPLDRRCGDGLGWGDVEFLGALGGWLTWAGLPGLVLLTWATALTLVLAGWLI
jgi:prepilin signal peptidase PulO-like enzyme (type II secretory pathway)